MAVWVCDDAALVDGLLHGDGVDDEGFEGDPVLAPSRSVVREDDSDDVLVCSHLLMGHASSITALAYSPVLDCCVSADVDGYLLVHACRSGRCLRSLQVVDRRESPAATKLAILDVDASVVVAASTTLALWSLNGGRVTMMTMFDGTSRAPGDFGWDPMGLMSPANEERMKMRELQHGRLAMIAIGGMIHGSFVTGTGVFGGMN